MKQLKEKIFLKEYLLAILIFVVVTFKFILTNQKFGLVEVVFVHYGVGLLLYMFLHYLIFVNKDIFLKYWKRVVLAVGRVVASVVLSVLIGTVIFEGKESWELFCRCAFLTFVFLCIDTIVSFIVKKINFDEFVGVLLFYTVTALAICMPLRNGISWDDQTHYERALCVSNMFDMTINGGDEVLIMSGVDSSRYDELTYNEYIEKVNRLYISERKSDVYAMSWDSKRYFPAYLPAAIGLLIGRGMGLPYVVTFLLGRLMNAWLYVFLVFKGIQQLKSGKLLLAIFAFYPTNVFLAANYSYDYWVTAFVMFSVSYFLGVMQDSERKMQLKDMLIIFGTMLLGLIPKATYFPMLIFFALINNKTKFDNNRTKKIYYILLILSIIIAVCWFVIPYLMSDAGGNDMRGGGDVNSSKQLVYIFSNPLQYTKILLDFLREYWSFNGIRGYMSFWAYMGFTPYHWSYVVCVIIAILIDHKECDNEMAGVIRKIVWGIMAFGISAINATALYIAFTPVGMDTIAGCQPRYLLPILFPTIYLLGSNWFSGLFKFLRNNLVYGTMIVFSVYVVLYSLWNISIIMWIG